VSLNYLEGLGGDLRDFIFRSFVPTRRDCIIQSFRFCSDIEAQIKEKEQESKDLKAEIKQLKEQLQAASDAAERIAIRGEIAGKDNRIAALQADITALRAQAYPANPAPQPGKLPPPTPPRIHTLLHVTGGVEEWENIFLIPNTPFAGALL